MFPVSYTHLDVYKRQPPFRHTHFDGKQVVVHNRLDDCHEVFSYNPVSYTHLDVYKRQPEYPARRFSHPHTNTYAGRPDLRRSTAPVSYTHLDVYKRQA